MRFVYHVRVREIEVGIPEDVQVVKSQSSRPARLVELNLPPSSRPQGTVEAAALALGRLEGKRKRGAHPEKLRPPPRPLADVHLDDCLYGQARESR